MCRNITKSPKSLKKCTYISKKINKWIKFNNICLTWFSSENCEKTIHLSKIGWNIFELRQKIEIQYKILLLTTSILLSIDGVLCISSDSVTQMSLVNVVYTNRANKYKANVFLVFIRNGKWMENIRCKLKTAFNLILFYFFKFNTKMPH